MKRVVPLYAMSAILALGTAVFSGTFEDLSSQTQGLLWSDIQGRMPLLSAPTKPFLPPRSADHGAWRSVSFSIKPELYFFTPSSMRFQPAALSVSFEVSVHPQEGDLHEVRNLAFKLEVFPFQDKGPYVMRSLGADSVRDYEDSEAPWGVHQLLQAKVEGDSVSFDLPVQSNIDARAQGSLMDCAVKRKPDGKVIGARAILQLQPVCAKDLSACSLGERTGIVYERAFEDWTDKSNPSLKLILDSPFAMQLN